MKYHLKSKLNWRSRFQRGVARSFGLTLLSCFITSVAIESLAETKQIAVDSTVLFRPPPESERPENTDSAASRQNQQCLPNTEPEQPELTTSKQTVTPIVPEGNYGLTLTERPNFWLYLPRTPARQIILTIREEGLKPHWQQSVNLTEETGIVGIPLADNAPILEIGKNYQWAVIVVCNERPHPNDPVVTSWIKRVEPPVESSSQTELQKAADYARQGIWYDALNILVAEKSSTDNWQNIWFEYLQSGGLEVIADEPIINK